MVFSAASAMLTRECGLPARLPCRPSAYKSRRVRSHRLHIYLDATASASVGTSTSAESVAAEAAGEQDPRKTQRTLSKISNANFPADEQGRTYHLGTKRGEVANRVLSVGSAKRAMLLAEFLEPCQEGHPLFVLESSRGFITITGLYQGVPVSIICTHMGMPNMDFVVRETRAVVDGQLAIVRLGTCGGLQPEAQLGNVVLACPGSICVRRNPDAFTLREHSPGGQAWLHLQPQRLQQLVVGPEGHALPGDAMLPEDLPAASAANNGRASGKANGKANGSVANGNSNGRIAANGRVSNGNGHHHAAGARALANGGEPQAATSSPSPEEGRGPSPDALAGGYYQVSLPVPSDEQLTSLLDAELRLLVGEQHVNRGLNASADSFYSSQGRVGDDFDDENEALLESLVTTHPECLTLEMETFHLLDLARCSRGKVVCAAAAIVLAQRTTNEFLDAHALYLREKACGTAALNALVKRQLDVQHRPGVEYLWD